MGKAGFISSAVYPIYADRKQKWVGSLRLGFGEVLGLLGDQTIGGLGLTCSGLGPGFRV